MEEEVFENTKMRKRENEDDNFINIYVEGAFFRCFQFIIFCFEELRIALAEFMSAINTK